MAFFIFLKFVSYDMCEEKSEIKNRTLKAVLCLLQTIVVYIYIMYAMNVCL